MHLAMSEPNITSQFQIGIINKYVLEVDWIGLDTRKENKAERWWNICYENCISDRRA